MSFYYRAAAFCFLFSFFWIVSDTPADIAQIKLASLFADNMVLQRGKPDLVWGWATPRDKITVSLGNKKVFAQVASDGSWSVQLPLLPAGGPYELLVSGINKVIVHNVFIGDVWLCAGQSNMQLPLIDTDPKEFDLAGAKPFLHFFIVPQNPRDKIQENVNGKWIIADPKNISTISAIAYHFANELYPSNKVPIGIIQSAATGSPIKSWLSEDVLGYPPKKLFHYHTSALFNGMIAPFLSYGIKGIVWYQGEADIFEAHSYRKLLISLIRDWRQRLNQGAIPFYCIQLPNYGRAKELPTESAWAQLREAQFQALKKIPQSYLIVTIDTAGENAGLHSKYKREIGHRLAMSVLSNGRYQSRIYQSMCRLGNKIDLSFMSFMPTSFDSIICKGDKVEGFAIAGDDRKFYWAEAQIENNGKNVLVWSAKVPNPVAVRYAWADNPKCNLYDKNNLPVMPFRTDPWKCNLLTQHYDFTNDL